MECNDVREELVAYIDNELSAMGVHAIETHLADCKECVAERDKLKATIESTHKVEDIQPAQNWWETLQERLYAPDSDLVSAIHALRESITHLESRTDGGLVRSAPVKEIMTLEEVAAYLQIEPDVMWKMFNEIPHFEVGDELRFKKSSVDEWIRMKESGSRGELFDWDLSTGWLDRVDRLGH
jgi:excisionase family DNA binding protein